MSDLTPAERKALALGILSMPKLLKHGVYYEAGWLAARDYYNRSGLDVASREIETLCERETVSQDRIRVLEEGLNEILSATEQGGSPDAAMVAAMVEEILSTSVGSSDAQGSRPKGDFTREDIYAVADAICCQFPADSAAPLLRNRVDAILAERGTHSRDAGANSDAGKLDECSRCEGTGDRLGRGSVISVCPDCGGSGEHHE